jgi:Protein of unknown function (DUF3054)
MSSKNKRRASVAVKKYSTPFAALDASKPGNKKESQRFWTVLIGDILVFLIFSVIGTYSHEDLLGIGKVIWTALPFILSWFLIAPFLGAFRRELMTQPKAMALRTMNAWLVAWPLSVALHFVFEWHVISIISTVSFAIVALITNAIFLFVWRVPFAIANVKRDHQG